MSEKETEAPRSEVEAAVWMMKMKMKKKKIDK